MSRSFQLPQDIDQTQAKARYDNGVLTLTLPKKLAGGSQRLAIDETTYRLHFADHRGCRPDGNIGPAEKYPTVGLIRISQGDP